MKTKLPLKRRKFACARDEMDDLYYKLLDRLYEQNDLPRARKVAQRLVGLLTRAAPGHEAIFPDECWSLAYETYGDLPKAIEHRENEIRLIRRLHEISVNTPHEKLIFDRYSYNDLSERLDLLAILYRDAGDLDKALSTIQESKRLCKKHGVAFDGEDILQ